MAHLLQAVLDKKGIRNYNNWNEDNAAESSNFPLDPYIRQKESFILPTNVANRKASINGSILNKQYKLKATEMPAKMGYPNDRKSQVYVHHYSKVPNRSPSNLEQGNWREGSEIHQHMYRHEFTNYYDAKIRTLRKQFDSLTLRKGRGNTPNKSQRSFQYNYLPDDCNPQNKIQHIWSNGSGKVNRMMFIRPENKSVMDKLEETYWAKWKPINNQQSSKEIFPKSKRLYTKNDPLLEKAQKSTRKERGDSNKAFSITPILSIKPHMESEMGIVHVEKEEEQAEQSASDENETETQEDKVVDQQTSTSNAKIKTSTSTAHKSVSECSSVGKLPHNDSFILTAKKQSQEKTHYQQPKCIKLFKNAGYSQNTSINYVKGGSYPLKSCLKRGMSVSKPSHFGRPGSPVKGPTIRKAEKANRFTK